MEHLDVYTPGDRFVVLADNGTAVEYLVRADGTLAEYNVQLDERTDLEREADRQAADNDHTIDPYT